MGVPLLSEGEQGAGAARGAAIPDWGCKVDRHWEGSRPGPAELGPAARVQAGREWGVGSGSWQVRGAEEERRRGSQ